MEGARPGEEDVARLLAAPLSAFTQTRNDLARSLAAAGESARAQAVRALRKPPPITWALNQVARRHPDLLQRLLQAGERLRRAQRHALESGSGAELRAAMQGARALEVQLAETAVAILRGERKTVSPSMQSHLQALLHDVVVGDPARRRQLQIGALLSLDPLRSPVSIPALRYTPPERAHPSARHVREAPAAPSRAEQQRARRAAREAERLRQRKRRKAEQKAGELEAEAQRLDALWQRQQAMAERTRQRAEEAKKAAKQARRAIE